MLRSRLLPKLLQSSLKCLDAVQLTAVTGCQHDVLLSSNGHQLCQQRSLMIFDVFSKQRKAERKRKIKEDTEHGCECTSAFMHLMRVPADQSSSPMQTLMTSEPSVIIRGASGLPLRGLLQRAMPQSCQTWRCSTQMELCCTFLEGWMLQLSS